MIVIMSSTDGDRSLDERAGATDGDRPVPDWLKDLREGPAFRRQFGGEILMMAVMLSLSSVVEAAVPPLRALGGRRGVQVGPAVGSLAAVALGVAEASHIFREVEARPDDHVVEPSRSIWDRWLEVVGVGLPALGALLPVTVVARDRSPLWGWALLPVPRIIAIVIMVLRAGYNARRHAGDQPGQASASA
jgi:hypothetical protein